MQARSAQRISSHSTVVPSMRTNGWPTAVCHSYGLRIEVSRVCEHGAHTREQSILDRGWVRAPCPPRVFSCSVHSTRPCEASTECERQSRALTRVGIDAGGQQTYGEWYVMASASRQTERVSTAAVEHAVGPGVSGSRAARTVLRVVLELLQINLSPHPGQARPSCFVCQLLVSLPRFLSF